MKHDTFRAYSPSGMANAEKALLTAWSSLSSFHDDLVLVGGLAIKHLTSPPTAGHPGPITLDVDFGICIAASNGMYGSIRSTLEGHGFTWSNDQARFSKEIEQSELFIDLLTDDGGDGFGTVIIDDSLAVGTIPGIQRALDHHRRITIPGTTLIGSQETASVKVTEVGPLLVLKLIAFGGPEARRAPKDVHDLCYLAEHYLDGIDAAISDFHSEVARGGKAALLALDVLKKDFTDEHAPGPIACAAFRLNNQHQEPAFREEALLIQQQSATLAYALLA